MPILNVKVSAPRSEELPRKIVILLLSLTSKILKKDPSLTSIAIDYVHPQDWYIAGMSLHEINKTSIYFDIRITDETNTKDEKALYIHKAFEGFSKLFGNLHEESYIHILDVRADAYGYGGFTQEWRYHHPQQPKEKHQERLTFT